MTHPVSQRAREAAWPFRAECYGAGDQVGWMNGKYDHNRAIQAFAQFEREVLEESVAWADKLIDQSDEPEWLTGNYAERMNYWWDKAILAGLALGGALPRPEWEFTWGDGVIYPKELKP